MDAPSRWQSHINFQFSLINCYIIECIPAHTVSHGHAHVIYRNKHKFPIIFLFAVSSPVCCVEGLAGIFIKL